MNPILAFITYAAFILLIGTGIRLAIVKRNQKEQDIEQAKNLFNTVAIIFAISFVLAIVTAKPSDTAQDVNTDTPAQLQK